MAQTAGEHRTWKTARLDWLERLLFARAARRGCHKSLFGDGARRLDLVRCTLTNAGW